MGATNAIRADRWRAVWEGYSRSKSAKDIAVPGLTPEGVRTYTRLLDAAEDPKAYAAARIAGFAAKATLLTPEPPTLAEAAEAAAVRVDQANAKRMLDALLKERGVDDRLIAAATASAQRVPAAQIPPRPQATRSDREPQHAVLLASDWHLGAVVDPEEVAGLGGYDFDTFCRRLVLLAHKVSLITEEFQTLRPIRKLTIPLLGDIVDGDSIFPSQEVDFSVLDQVYLGALKTAEFLTGLLHVFEQVEVIALPGNHGRYGRKGERKKKVSFDRQLAMFAMELTKSTDRISWVIPTAPFYDWEVMGHPIHAEHYDSIKSWNGLPYYGLDRAAGRLTQIANAQGRKFSLMVGGHYHSQAVLERPGGLVMLNGSMIGPTDFSVDQMKTISRPSQKLFFMSAKQGVNSEHTLWLDAVQRRAVGQVAA